MINDRDKLILKWIEDYKAITVKQCTEIFFNGNYEGCRRRLKQLEGFDLIDSYNSKLLKEKVYYNGNKKVSDHDLLIIDFIKEIYKLGGSIRNLKTQPHYLDNTIIPDAYVEIIYKNQLYFVLLEVDLTHYTTNIKMQNYEKLFKSGELQKSCYGEFPIILISRPTQGIRYNSHNFECIYCDLNYAKLKELLFQEL